MGKLINRPAPTLEDYRAGRTDGPLYDKETQLYPVEALPQRPIVSEDEQRLVNYNWVMAKAIALLKENRLTASQAGDIMDKAGRLFKLAYAKVYGKAPVLPAFDIRDAN